MASPSKRRRVASGGASGEVEELRTQLQQEQLHHQVAMLKLKEEAEKQQRLKRNLDWQQQQNDEHIRDRASEREEALKARYELESKHRVTEQAVRELKEQLAACESQARDRDSAVKHEKQGAEGLREESTHLHQRNAELQARNAEMQETLQEMCRKEPTQVGSEGASALLGGGRGGSAAMPVSSDTPDVTELREELRAKERQARELERVVKAQRAEIANEQLLRQQVAELKEQRDRARAASASHVEVQEQLKAMEEQRQVFAQAFAAFEAEGGAGAGSSAPMSASADLSQLKDGVLRTLQRLRREQLRVAESEGKWKVGKQEAQLKRDSAQDQLGAESRRRKDAESLAAEQAAKAERLAQENLQLSRKCERLQSNLRQLDASLETTVASDDSAAADALAQKDRRVVTLEEMLKEAEKCAESARSEAEALAPRSVLAKETERVEELQKECTALHEQIRRLEKSLERSETENAEMDVRLGRGEFNRATTKIVHFANNPTAQAKENSVATLRRENAELKAQLSERAHSFKSGLTPGSALHKSRESASDKGQGSADHATHLNRLKQVCACCVRAPHDRRHQRRLGREPPFSPAGHCFPFLTQPNPRRSLCRCFASRCSSCATLSTASLATKLTCNWRRRPARLPS